MTKEYLGGDTSIYLGKRRGEAILGSVTSTLRRKNLDLGDVRLRKGGSTCNRPKKGKSSTKKSGNLTAVLEENVPCKKFLEARGQNEVYPG